MNTTNTTTTPLAVPVLRETVRGCGWRKPGGTYMVSGVLTLACDKLPIPLTVCPCCQQGIKPARGWAWIGHEKIVQPGPHMSQSHSDSCVLAKGSDEVATDDGRIGLIWVGESFYRTPQEYTREALRMGVSRRVHGIPHGFKVGKTMVLLAHRKALASVDGSPPRAANVASVENLAHDPSHTVEWVPGAFAAFVPERVEYVLKPEEESDQDRIAQLRDRGVTPVIVRPVGGPGDQQPLQAVA